MWVTTIRSNPKKQPELVRPGISTIIDRVRTGKMTTREAIDLWEDTIGRGDYMRKRLQEAGVMYINYKMSKSNQQDKRHIRLSNSRILTVGRNTTDITLP